MNYNIQIAFKYLFAKKNKNVVNIIAFISVVGVLFGTMAMVVVLSVFNGFDDVVNSIYENTDPDLKVEFKNGKLFNVDEDLLRTIEAIDGVAAVTKVLEQKMLAEYLGSQLVANVKGVDSRYLDVIDFRDNIILGDYFNQNINFVILGNDIFNAMSLKLLDFDDPLNLSFFKKLNTMDINQSINTDFSYVSGVFSTQTEFDSNYIICSIEKIQDFTNSYYKLSSLEIRVDNPRKTSAIKTQISQDLGDDYIIKNRFQQRPFIYKMVKTEKLAVYIIFTFILLISMLSLIATLVVLLMEKQRDLQLFYSLGLPLYKIKNIFFITGFSITLIGTLLGTFSGFFLCLLQQKFQFIKLGATTFFIEAYPIKIIFSDIIMIQLIVLILGCSTSYLVSRHSRFYHV